MDYTPTTALVVVDVQNDFADPDGSLFVAGGRAAVPFINEQIESAHEASATVVYTRDWHPDTTPHFAKDGGIWPVHCVGDTWGSDFHPDLAVSGPEIKKGTGGEDGYSGFCVRDPETGAISPTGLEDLLRHAEIASDSRRPCSPTASARSTSTLVTERGRLRRWRPRE